MSASLTSQRVEGIDLLVREGDPARTVFFLHGIGGRASSFAEVMQRWPAGPRLIAWDMPGYGKSVRCGQSVPKPQNYAALLLTVLDKLSARPADIVGQSLGGLIAGTMAARFPKYVRRLALVSAAHGYQAHGDDPLPPSMAQRIADFRAEGAEAFAAKRARRLVFDADNRPHVVTAVREAMATLTDPGHTDAVQGLASGDLMRHMADVRCPVLLLSGSDDVITPLAGTKALLAELTKRLRAPGVSERLVEIPRAGHAAFLEDPEAFIAAIAAYLAEEAPA